MKLVWKYAGLPASNSASEKKSSRTRCAHKYISDWHTIYFFLYRQTRFRSNAFGKMAPLLSSFKHTWTSLVTNLENTWILRISVGISDLQVSFDIFSPQKTSYIIRLFKLQRIRNLCKIKKKIGCCPSSREITI